MLLRLILKHWEKGRKFWHNVCICWVYTWVLITGKFRYLQLFDATGRYMVIEMCLQPLYICHKLHIFLLQVGQPVFRHLSLNLLLSHLGLLKEHLSVLFLLQRLNHSSWQLPDPHLTCGFLMTYSLISDERVCHIINIMKKIWLKCSSRVLEKQPFAQTWI